MPKKEWEVLEAEVELTLIPLQSRSFTNSYTVCFALGY